jgi:hypothetical protein
MNLHIKKGVDDSVRGIGKVAKLIPESCMKIDENLFVI